MSEFILWEEVNKRLPIEQDPERRDQRKALFKKILPKDKKTLSLEDVQKGMKNELRHDMAGSYVPGIVEMGKTIKFAFKASSELAPSAPKAIKREKTNTAKVDTGVAHAKSKSKDKGKGETVDKREFHAFLLALKYYLELAEFFEVCDAGFDDDQKLSQREVMKGSATLALWGITEDDIKAKFTGVDPWKATLKYDDFNDWIMGVRMASIDLKLDDSDDDEVQLLAAGHDLKQGVDLTFTELGADSDMNQIKVAEKFAAWDSDGSGGISKEELTAVMKELNPDFTDKKVSLLFEAADVNHDGNIDFNEFIAFIFRQK